VAAEQLPLSALLSHMLVGLTIEVDNAYETRAPHSTTLLGGSGPWLTSYAMWANFLRLVPPDGIPVRDLAARAGWAKWPHPSQAGMERWGYVRAAPEKSGRSKPPRSAWIVRPTAAGARAAAIWAELPASVEARWGERFGAPAVTRLRDLASDLVGRLDLALPAYLPQLGYGLVTEAPSSEETVPGEPGLLTALANVLHAFAIDYERDAPVGLAAAANTLRVVGIEPVRVRDVPRLAGIGKEAADMAIGLLAREFVNVEPDPQAKRGKVVRLNRVGVDAQADYAERVTAVEAAWTKRFGKAVTELRAAAEQILGVEDGAALREAVAAPDGTWRATVEPPEVIPHFPMILHRGGYPDGA
jgi:hypothetical protein